MKKSVLFICFFLPQVVLRAQDKLPAHARPNSYSGELRGGGMSFTPNKGQITDMDGKQCPDVLYKGDGAGASIYLRKTGVSYVLSNMGEVMRRVNEEVEENEHEFSGERKLQFKEQLMQKAGVKLQRVDVDFADGNLNPEIITNDRVEGYANYYFGHCPQGITNVSSYNEITVKNIYHNIDVKYYGGKEKGLKYDIVVTPGGNPGDIKLKYTGAESIALKEGKLKIKTSVGDLCEYMPKVYQNINGKIVDVIARYVLRGTTLSFELGAWKPSFPLVIDPWATYYGGSSADYGTNIATDKSGSGDVLVTGYTYSTNFPVTGPQIIYGGGWTDSFILKFTSSGSRLWATYYGGSATDDASGIATDNLGNVTITGYTSSNDFPVFGGFSNVFSSGTFDTFLVKFTPSGIPVWSTFYGGSGTDYGVDVATDNSGNVVFTGYTSSIDFPVAGGYQGAIRGPYDAFVVKFNAAGVRQWATFYGGDNFEYGRGITTDTSDNIIICGETTSSNFPVLSAFQPAFGGGTGIVYDAFVVKFNTFGIRQWATFYGGSANDKSLDITTDTQNNLIVTGYTGSADFPALALFPNVVQQPVYGGPTTSYVAFGDAFVLKFNPTGTRQWATYYGTNVDEWGWGVATDKNDNIYLLMEAEDVATPSLVDACSYQPVFNGGATTNPNISTNSVEDQLIVKFAPDGKKICSTYMGGTGEDDLDNGGGIAVYGNALYITGTTDGGYPVTPGAFQTVFGGPTVLFVGGGPWDAFIAQICTNICEGKTLGLSFTSGATSVCANAPVKFTPTVTNSCDTTGYKFHWIFTGGNPASSDSVKPTVTFSGAGAHDVKLVVTTLCKIDSITKNNYVLINNCGCNLSGQFTKGTASCTACGCKEWIMVNASGGTSPYSYTWSDGYDKRYKNQLCPGAYTINIKDKNGCSVNVNLSAP